MKLTTLVARVNGLLDGENIAYTRMIPFLDQAIDDINQQLNSVYPVFSELEEGTTEYSYFPDRYLRTVVAYGAAMYFYITDEEGSAPPMSYTELYNKNLFLMYRDWLTMVPPEYEATDTLGAVQADVPNPDASDVDREAFVL